MRWLDYAAKSLEIIGMIVVTFRLRIREEEGIRGWTIEPWRMMISRPGKALHKAANLTKAFPLFRAGNGGSPCVSSSDLIVLLFAPSWVPNANSCESG